MTTAIALLQAATPGSEPHVIPFFVFTLLKLIAVFTVYMVGVARSSWASRAATRRSTGSATVTS